MDIHEMKHDEIVAMKDEDIIKMKNFILASNGVRFVEMPEKPEKPIVERDDVTYEWSGIVTQNRELLVSLRNQVEEHSRDLATTAYGDLGYDYKHIAPIDDYNYKNLLKINEIKVYKQSTLTKYARLISDFADKERFYKEHKELYDKMMDQEQSLTGDVVNKINAHKQLERESLECVDIFNNKYMKLADNDFEIAFNFFKEAYQHEAGYTYFEWKIKSIKEDGCLLESPDIHEIADQFTY